MTSSLDCCRGGGVASEFVEPVVVLLRQLGEVVSAMSDGQYVQSPVGVIQSSVGGHVRHCLDHVRALVLAAGGGEGATLSYDHRHRGTPVESSRGVALEAIEELSRSLGELTEEAVQRRLLVSVLMTANGPAVEARSSVGRELAFVLSHTIHHNALVGAMAAVLGVPMPARFGYAPDTVRHFEALGVNGVARSTACARQA